MKRLIGWTLKALGLLLGSLLAALVVLLLVIWVADPAVARNMLFGQRPTDPTTIEKSQPQALVRGAPRDDIPMAAATFADPDGMTVAEAYADATDSVALLVYERGALRYEKYWPGFDRGTRTNPNSMHKTVLGLLIGAAIDDGHIASLDSPAAEWLSEWQGDARRRITVRDLLQMSSGLEVPVFGTWNSTRILLGSDLASGVLGLPAVKAHGSEFQYSNASSQLLLILLERATGQRYADYLSSRLWRPLGAADASLWMDRDGGLPRGFCCLFASARDWLRVGRLFLEQGRAGGQQVVSTGWIAAMLQPAATNPNFGLHIWLGSPPTTQRRYNDYAVKAFHSTRFAADDIAYIDGFGGQRVYIVPSRELVIVRLGVSRTDWDDAILPNAVLRALGPAGGVP
jgi:CubicO group peptidase (beta-lactamase class C family)